MTLETLEEALEIKKEIDVLDEAIRNLEEAATKLSTPKDNRKCELDSYVGGGRECHIIVSQSAVERMIVSEAANLKGKRTSLVSRLAKM